MKYAGNNRIASGPHDALFSDEAQISNTLGQPGPINLLNYYMVAVVAGFRTKKGERDDKVTLLRLDVQILLDSAT